MDNTLGILLFNIRKRRKELHLTQKEVAEKCGLKQANYSRMESGKQSPNLDTLIKLAKILKLSISLNPCDEYVYHIMYMNELVTVVRLSYDKKRIHFDKIRKDGPFQPFSGSKLDLERFYRFIKSRCYEDERADLSDILSELHLSDNNPYDFIQITHGVTYEDFFWIKMDYEKLKWEDVRLR